MYRRVGLGAPDITKTVSASSVSTNNINQGSVDCQWCRANPFLSVFVPSCYQLNDTVCNFQSIPQAFQTGGVPAMPPDQQTIDAQTPDQTIDQILQQSQQNAVNAATAAAAQDAALQAATSIIPGVCVKGSPLYSPFMCFLNDYGILLAVGGLSLWLLVALGGRR